MSSRPAFKDQVARHVMAASCAIGMGLMIWTWVRAAAMSADGAHYMELAERAWRLNAGAGMDWYAGPGYPVLVGWLYGLIGDLDFAGRLTSCMFAVGTLVGVGLLSFRMFGCAVACVSVGLLAVHTTFVRHAVMAETDAAYGCWLVWSILFVWELRHSIAARHQICMATLAAVSLGLGFLTRPEAVPLAGLLGLWYLFSKRSVIEPSKSGRATFSNAAASVTRRLAWSTWIAIIFVAIASPYLLKLRAELGRWSLSGKERSIVLKFVPDKANYEKVLELGVTGALLRKPSSILHWLPYHLHWGIPQFVKALNPIVLVLVGIGLFQIRRTPRMTGSIALLLWVTVPFILFFFLTFPGRRYFMQALPQWTILAAAGSVQLAERIAGWRSRIGVGNPFRVGEDPRQPYSNTFPIRREIRTPPARRAFTFALAAPMLLTVASTVWGNRNPIEGSLCTERRVGERIFQSGGPGRRVLSFTVAAFYARGERVPLWGPMQGIVRCHGYGRPLSYDDFVDYVRRHCVDYIVLDEDLRADCPEFLDRVRSEDFELVANDIVDQHGPHLIFRALNMSAQQPHAN
jgi:uncharacterized membrane protein